MGLDVKISRNGGAAQEIVHGLVKLNPVRCGVVVEEEKDVGIIFVAHADLNLVRHFEQRMNVAQLAEPGD